MTVPTKALLPRFPQEWNAQLGAEQPFIALSEAADDADSGAIFFVRPHSRVSMQVSFSAGGATVKVYLKGTIDGVNWFIIGTFDTGASGASGDIVTSSSAVVAGVKVMVETLSAGTVSVAVLAGQYNGG